MTLIERNIFLREFVKNKLENIINIMGTPLILMIDKLLLLVNSMNFKMRQNYDK